MVHNRRTDSQATLWSVRSAERNWKGVPLSVGAMLQRKDRSPPDLFLSHYSIAPYASQEKTEGRNVCGRITENSNVQGRCGRRRRAGVSLLLRHQRRAVLRDPPHSGGYGGSRAGDRVGDGGQVGVQPLPQMWEVCILRYVQCQRGAVSGLRPVGGRVPLVLPSLWCAAPGIGHLLLPTCGAKLIADGMDRKEGTP